MKKSVYLLSIILVLFIAAPFAGCGGGGSGGGDNEEAQLNPEAPVYITNDETEVSATVGVAGGTIEVTNPESDMNKAKIVIPPNAISQNTTISLKQNDTVVGMPIDMTNGGVVIDFGPNGTTFKSNATITIPYEDVDNDGYVDYTDTLETELKVVYWDNIAGKWITNENIINRDTVNNTITFETNHFSDWTTSAECKNVSHGPIFIYTIDGLDFQRSFVDYRIIMGFPYMLIPYPARTGYLKAAVLEAGIVKKCDCHSFGGNDSDQSWNGDAKETSGLINGLVDDLKKAKDYAKGQKFVVLTHSWGTQLGMIGLSELDPDYKADLFITLSNPQGSPFVETTEYNNENIFDSAAAPKIKVIDVEAAIYDFVNITGYPHLGQGLIQTTDWINYWDVGDLISGPLNFTGPDNKKMDNREVNNDNDQRNWTSTWENHSITSLCCEGHEYWKDSDSYWEEEGVAWYGKILRDKVAHDILSIIDPLNDPVTGDPITSSTTGSVSGKLHSGSATGSALSGADVTCGGKSAKTASNGTFSLPDIQTGTQTITFSKSGYETYEQSLIVNARLNTDVGDRWLEANYSDPPSNSTPDLAINELNISNSEDEGKHSLHLKPGEKYYIWVKIKNRGEVDATTAYKISYLLSYDNKINQGDNIIYTETDKEDIEAGETHSNGRHVKAPLKPGVYYIGAQVDSPQDMNKKNDYSRGDDERARITVDYPTQVITEPINQLVNSMIYIPSGSFMMGSEDNDYAMAQYTTPVHKVILHALNIGAYEVTQAQYLAVMGTNPSYFQGASYPNSENYPVDAVSWYDALEFCGRLSALTGRTFTLPSEAQWEYACRAGTTTIYSFGDDDEDLDKYAWWRRQEQTHPIGTKLPNPWGLYDMHGNVWEWCLDSWHPNYLGAPTDGSAWEPDIGSYPVLRSGSWDIYGSYRSASRFEFNRRGDRSINLGFRVIEVR
jgi:formylglycine-generating enzyme required for sulfatase activity